MTSTDAIFSRLLWENLAFALLAVAFLTIAARAWRDLKPFELPKPLPNWFKVWFGTVQIGGGLLPIVGLILAIALWNSPIGALVLGFYLLQLAGQIGAEIFTLYQLRSPVWVMVPYLFIPFRFWQLYEGLTWLSGEGDERWLVYLLLANLPLWLGNYLLDLAQLPRLLRWPGAVEGEPSPEARSQG